MPQIVPVKHASARAVYADHIYLTINRSNRVSRLSWEGMFTTATSVAVAATMSTCDKIFGELVAYLLDK